MNDEEQARLEAIGDQLRAKISSKFQTSTFLAGFAFTVLGIQISLLWQWQGPRIPLLLFVSISLLVMATILYIGAIVRLDELTMPKRFWDPDDNVSETKSAALAYLTQDNLFALKDRMVFYWQRLTLGATYLTAASLGLMLLPVPLEELPASPCNTQARWLIFSGMAVLALAAAYYLKWLDGKADKKFAHLKRPKD